MKVLVLGLDNSILDRNSKLAKRAVDYGNLVDKYLVIIPSKENKVLELTNKTVVYGVKAGNKIFGLFKIYNLAKKIIAGEGIDVISVQDQYYLGLIGFLLARKFDKGLEIQVHGFEKYGGLRKIISKYVLPRAGAVRVVSHRLKRRLIDDFKVREEKIMVVSIYVERAPHNLERAPHNYGKFVFLTVGRLVPIKNIGMQIEVMKEVVKKYSDAELWIIGEGSERNNLEFRIKNLELGGKIKMFGWQNNIDKFYKQANVFLLTSHSEGWPLAILEAANYGLPIIMTDVGSAGELIINNESGIVIPTNDKIKLKEAMTDLIKNSEIRKKIGEGAKRAVLNLPAKEKVLGMYKKSWELALKNKS